MKVQAPVVMDPPGAHRATVVWLHGLGADGYDFVPVAQELDLMGRGLRFVFPHAPERPVTLNGGMVMSAWYDLLGLDEDAPQDEHGLRLAKKELEQLLSEEHDRGIPYERIVLAGFSMGGALALYTALRTEFTLGGIIGWSTYVPLIQRLHECRRSANRTTPIFMAHGSEDQVIPLAFGRHSYEALVDNGFEVSWHEYPMGHAVCEQEIKDLRRWLVRLLDRDR